MQSRQRRGGGGEAVEAVTAGVNGRLRRDFAGEQGKFGADGIQTDVLTDGDGDGAVMMRGVSVSEGEGGSVDSDGGGGAGSIFTRR